MTNSANKLPAYQVYLDARSMLMTWIGISVGILTVIGIVSINDVKRGTLDYSQDQIKVQLEDKNSNLSKEIIEKLNVEDLKNTLIREISPDIKKDVNLETDAKIATLEVEIDNTIKNPSKIQDTKYVVVVASSPVKNDVENEKETVLQKLGGKLNPPYNSMKICPPKTGVSERYVLLLDSPQTSQQAISLASQVKEDNIFSDAAGAYPTRSDSAFFHYPDLCQSIQI